MKFTNKYNLPQTLVNMLANDPYTKGDADFSVTEIISPPRIRALQRRHYSDMETDLTDRLWSLTGRALHEICQQGASNTHIVEERLYGRSMGHTISGAIDVQEVLGEDEWGVDDYKFVSVYSATSAKPEWEAQLNIYAWLMKQIGRRVTRLRIIAILRDWSRAEAQRNADYPIAPVRTIEIPLWETNETELYVARRVALHVAARAEGAELPECSDEERWQRPDSWAVQKPDAKRATKVFTDGGQAEAFASTKPGLVVVHRPGLPVRCDGNYCGVNEWCNQWKGSK